MFRKILENLLPQCALTCNEVTMNIVANNFMFNKKLKTSFLTIQSLLFTQTLAHKYHAKNILITSSPSLNKSVFTRTNIISTK